MSLKTQTWSSIPLYTNIMNPVLYHSFANHPSMAKPNLVWVLKTTRNPTCVSAPTLATDLSTFGRASFGLQACQVDDAYVTILEFLFALFSTAPLESIMASTWDLHQPLLSPRQCKFLFPVRSPKACRRGAPSGATFIYRVFFFLLVPP